MRRILFFTLLLLPISAMAKIDINYSSKDRNWTDQYFSALSIPDPYSRWSPQIEKPKHGAIYRFFHRKEERFWKGTHPALREKIEAIQAVMETEGYDLRPLESYRSPERQATLLASNSGVTGVGAWSSCHNYGLALDAVIYVDDKPSWDTTDPHVLAGYQRYGELAEILELNWGGRWTSPVDMPHVELKAECGQAKWARRYGKSLPAFVFNDRISSIEVLELAMSQVEPTNRDPLQWTWGNQLPSCTKNASLFA